MGRAQRRSVAAIAVGWFMANLVSCSSGQAPEGSVGSVRQPIVELEPATTVEAGTPAPSLTRSCPGSRYPDQCGSWAGVELSAARHEKSCKRHERSERDEDARCLCQPISFQIPSELPVTHGRAGWDWDKAELTFRNAAGKLVECRYRGNGSPPGRRAHQPTGGDKYLFERCSDGSLAGQTAQSDWFDLDLASGRGGPGHGHGAGADVEVLVRLGEADVVDGVVQEQVFYANDPLLAGAALHVPRGSAPAGETFSLERVRQVAPGTTIVNAGDLATTLGYAVDVHSDSTDGFVFTPVPGTCPRIELPYDPATLERVLGEGREDSIQASHVKTLTGLSSGAAVLESAGAVTVNRAAHTLSFCVEHLSIWVGIAAGLNSKLLYARIKSLSTESGALGDTNLLGPEPLPKLNAGEDYQLSLTYQNTGTAKWDGTTTGAPAAKLVPILSYDDSQPPKPTVLSTLSPWHLVTPLWTAPTHQLSVPAVAPPNTSAHPVIVSDGTVSFKITAPETDAPLSFCLRSGTNYFGDCFTWNLTQPVASDVPVALTKSCYCDSTSGCPGVAPATRDVGECRHGTSTRSGGAWGACAGAVGPSAEVCGNDKDEDCDGVADTCPAPSVGCSTATPCSGSFQPPQGSVPSWLFCSAFSAINNAPNVHATYTLTNTGTTSWDSSVGIHVYMAEIRSFIPDKQTFLLTDVMVPAGTTVAPGASYIFDFCPEVLPTGARYYDIHDIFAQPFSTTTGSFGAESSRTQSWVGSKGG